jgi:predicted secreted protein
MKKFLGLILVLFSFAACTGVPSEITLTASDSGKTINVSPNQMIALTLDSNATTGFKWNLVAEPDAKVLKFVSSVYNAPASGAIGAGGTETWKFQAVGAGTTTFKLAYFRPFDPKQVAGEFILNVTAK